jgi:hypothetical protein
MEQRAMDPSAIALLRQKELENRAKQDSTQVRTQDGRQKAAEYTKDRFNGINLHEGERTNIFEHLSVQEFILQRRPQIKVKHVPYVVYCVPQCEMLMHLLKQFVKGIEALASSQNPTGKAAQLFIQIARNWDQSQEVLAAFDLECFGAKDRYFLVWQMGYAFGASKSAAISQTMDIWQHPSLSDAPQPLWQTYSTTRRNGNRVNAGNHLGICLLSSRKNRNSLTWVLVALTVCLTYPVLYRFSVES